MILAQASWVRILVLVTWGNIAAGNAAVDAVDPGNVPDAFQASTPARKCLWLQQDNVDTKDPVACWLYWQMTEGQETSLRNELTITQGLVENTDFWMIDVGAVDPQSATLKPGTVKNQRGYKLYDGVDN